METRIELLDSKEEASHCEAVTISAWAASGLGIDGLVASQEFQRARPFGIHRTHSAKDGFEKGYAEIGSW